MLCVDDITHVSSKGQKPQCLTCDISPVKYKSASTSFNRDPPEPAQIATEFMVGDVFVTLGAEAS